MINFGVTITGACIATDLHRRRYYRPDPAMMQLERDQPLMVECVGRTAWQMGILEVFKLA